MSDFFTVVRRQRACRSFRDEPVADELVEQVLRAATFAPSAENRQPWVFVVVRDDEARRAIGELTRRAWERGGRAISEQRLTPTLLAEVDAGATGGVSAAPVLVVVGADTRLGLPQTVPSSIFPAIQNLLLAANALGLGSALTTIATSFADELRAIVGFPPEIVPVAVVPIGYPARRLAPPRRVAVTERTWRDRYGERW